MAFWPLRRSNDEKTAPATALADRLKRAALGDKRARAEVVQELSPIVQKHVFRLLMRYRRASGGRDTKQDVEDFVQDVLLSLFQDEGRELLRWDPAGASSFSTFIGLVTEREVYSILRSKRRNPWTDEPVATDEIERQDQHSSAETRVASKQIYGIMWGQLRDQVSDEGLQLFHLFFVEERTVEEICAVTGKKPDAIYQWRLRLLQRVRQIEAECLSDNGSANASENLSEKGKTGRKR